MKVLHHGDKTLQNFCKWQNSLNMNGDAHPQHHDTAVLITRCRWLGGAPPPPCSQDLILWGVHQPSGRASYLETSMDAHAVVRNNRERDCTLVQGDV